MNSLRKDRIEHLISKELSPDFLQVEDESHNHHVPKGAETHFKIIAVSETFKDLNRVTRHRLLNQLLAGEFETGMHALSIHVYTAEEWANKKQSVLKSPNCKDGFEK